MNVFEKYIKNVKENEDLTEIINDLCIVHFNKCKKSLHDIFDKEFVKFLKWEIDTSLCPSSTITMYYIAKDLKDDGKEKEFAKTFEWNNLMIKLEGYE